MQIPTRLVERTLSLLRSPLLAPVGDTAAIDDLLGQFKPEWALTQVKARIVAIRQQTPVARTLVLRPNGLWRGHAAGQHVAVTVEIDGRRLQRTYTLSSIAGDAGTLEITVKRQAGGKVSAWLNTRAQVGDVLGLSGAAGQFTLPAPLPSMILMVSAGSGITPVMAMLRALDQQSYAGDVFFLHQCRSPEDLIFGVELQQIAARLPGLKLHVHYSSESGRLDADLLKAIVPDYAARQAFLCGPQGFMDTVQGFYREQRLDGQLSLESFSGPILRAPAEGQAAVEVRCAKSEQVFTAAAAQPLLMEAEAAGLKPKHGCRIGICQSCKCRKREGTVQNLMTGEISSEPNEMIQLCVSVAKSDVTLDL
ncbi:MAG TPA: ferredoxin reductase [Solimonas sp.]|nr:ferredoxin reductase [Solimonas sp.]